MSFKAQVTPSCGRLSGQLVEDSGLEAPRVHEGRLDHDALQLGLGSLSASMKTVRPSLQAGLPGSPAATSNGRPEMADAKSAYRLQMST